jgi:hypothetical protein
MATAFRKCHETAMRAAFLTALSRKLERTTPYGKTMLPVGTVTDDELRRVLVALKCAGRDRTSNNQNRRRASR